MAGGATAEAEIDRLAMQALRLLPDEPARALRTWRRAAERAQVDGTPRARLRLEIVRLNQRARAGELASALAGAHDAQAQAAHAGWPVEEALARMLGLFVATLGSAHAAGLAEAEQVRATMPPGMEAEELAWLDLMVGHFLGYVAGWAEGQRLAYECLGRLVASPRAPAGLLANAKKSIGYSHLLVGNLDLARAHLEDAWRLYAPLPPTPRRLSAAKSLAQCLLALRETAAADALLGEALAFAPQASPLYAASALMAQAEIKVALGDVAAARAALAAGRPLADAEAEPAVVAHAAYVEALCLDAEGRVPDAAATALSACDAISGHLHEVAAQSCLQFAADLLARTGDFAGAYALQARLLDMRRTLALRAAEIRAIDRDAVMLRLDHVSASAAASARREAATPAAREARPADERLTPREMEVLGWCAQGKSNWSIGQIIGLSENTVKFHLKNLSRKLNASAKHHAVAEARRRGLI